MLTSNLYINPPFYHDLLVKLSQTGVTVLKDDKFRNRFSGSRGYKVRPNGVLIDVPTLKELEKTKAEREQEKKDKEKRKAYRLKRKIAADPQEKKDPVYTVNAKLIRGRTWAYVMAMKKPILHAVTISFPTCVSDDMGYQLLNTWLTVCKKSLHLKDFLWVAERQENKTIHFHLLIPQFLNINAANRAMKVCLATQIKKGRLNWSIHACKKYNGVDISKDRTTKKVTNFASPGKKKALVSYITKYISKNNTPFTHYAWHNSRGFSSMMLSVSLTRAEALFFKLRPHLNFDRTFAGEFATFIPWGRGGSPDFFVSLMRELNGEILDSGLQPIHKLMNFPFPLIEN